MIEAIDAVQAENATLRAKLTQVEQERDQLMSRSKEIDSELHKLEPYSAITVAGQVAELVADYQKLKQDRDRLAAEVADLKSQLSAAQQSAQEQYRKGMERGFPIILTAIKSYRSNIVCDEEGDGLELSDILAAGYKDADIRRALKELDGLHDHICACLLAELSKEEGK